MRVCVRCSTVEPYAANIVYPHKTGAYVQPVTKEQKETYNDWIDVRSRQRKLQKVVQVHGIGGSKSTTTKIASVV